MGGGTWSRDTCEEAKHASPPWICTRTRGTWKETLENDRAKGQKTWGEADSDTLYLDLYSDLAVSFKVCLGPPALSYRAHKKMP